MTTTYWIVLGIVLAAVVVVAIRGCSGDRVGPLVRDVQKPTENNDAGDKRVDEPPANDPLNPGEGWRW